MSTPTVDPRIQYVVDNMRTIVASEGGTLEIVDLSNGRLKARYVEGRNEECPECVPSHDMVSQMMGESLKVHAPYVTEFELV